jgi:N-acetylmuramoyl-L-alanine amidase
MLTALFYEVRIWPVLWRRRLAYYWAVGDKGALVFFLMLALPIVSLAGIIYIAYVNGPRVEPVHIQAAQQQRLVARERRRADDLQCLAENVYFEARGEPLQGQFAVAEVTLNRTRAPNFPHTICGVVHERRWDPGRRRFVADFSWTELGEMSAQPGPAWKQAMAVATAAYDDTHDPIIPGALFYHATTVRPGWARTRKAVATIGNHVFYE